jgi:hypothetical protein
MPPSTDWKEVADPAEGAQFERLAQVLSALQRRKARGGRLARAVHSKGQLGVEGQLEILPSPPEVPEAARVALFARPAKYRAYVRFSNGSPARQTDRKPDVRGVALKIVGVAGKKVIPGMEDAVTQDFLMIRSPTTGFRDAREFVAVLVGAGSPPFGLFKAAAELGLGRLIQILKVTLADFKRPTISLATTRYFSAAPIRFGAYAVHYALAPRARDVEGAKTGPGADYLADELAARLREGPVTYDLQVQFFVDEAKTPIEDGSVEWKEADTPFVTVARLTLPKQDTTSDAGRALSERIESFSFDPWHALEELRPLGNLMRARNVAYRISTAARAAAAEPTS